MRVLCVGRHPYLSEHLGRYFERLGVDTVPCVGIVEAVELVGIHDPDAIICDYDLLSTISLGTWEHEPALADIPLIAVSLTRHPGEAHLFDMSGIDGFLYLPTLQPEDAHRVLDAVRRKRGGINPPNVLPWPGTTPVARLR
jgi:CheY-like chemotaxis protein